MYRILSFLVEAVYWFGIFLSPTGLIAILAGILYGYAHFPEWVAWTVAGTGPVVGVIFAERVRRKYGCSTYWSRIESPPQNPE
ncbi:MAG: hypothetical protein U0176_17235 [Bacteroidia bacterium]